MSNIKMSKFAADPRLASAAKKAGCTPDQFLARICRNSGKKLTK